MKLLTPLQMNGVDRGASERFKIPSLLLMEQAARQVFDYINTHYKETPVTILCGPGNNGGDGLALGWLLTAFTRAQVKIGMLAPYEKLTADGQIYYQMAERSSAQIILVNEGNKGEMITLIQESQLIVDALFGTGLSRPVEGIYKEMVERVNSALAPVISVDIPSGINGITGKVMGIGIKADVTLTFMAPKRGLFLYPGILYTGEVKVVPIGIPDELIQEVDSKVYTIEKEEMAAILPQRPVRSNKGTFGKVLTVGGSLGMTGAITLTSLAAYKTGCGTVTAAVPGCIIEIIQQKLTEVMALPLAYEGNNFAEESANHLQVVLPTYQVVAIGPGMGRGCGTLAMLKMILAEDQPCVVDADALYFIKEVKGLLKKRKAPTILTPHPGEMARMMDKTIEEILEDPIEVATKFAADFGVIVILKIEKTVIADMSGNIYINRCGNSGLAKGGSGDTLTGILAGLLAQHLEPMDAARLGVYLQTRAADLAAKALTQYSYLASDVINYISHVYQELMTDK